MLHRPAAPHQALYKKREKNKAASNTSVAAVIEVTKYGISKVLGKGQLPTQPVVVKAKFFSKPAEKRIKEVGSVCVLTA